MSAVKARAVRLTQKVGLPEPFYGVQDEETGVVYPYPEEHVVRIAREVNAGSLSLAGYQELSNQDWYDVEEVES